LLAALAQEIGPALMRLRPDLAKALLRETLARAVAADAPPEDYRLWSSLFDVWSPDDLPAVQGSPSLGYLVFHDREDAGRTALDATIAGLHRQFGPAQPHEDVYPASSGPRASPLFKPEPNRTLMVSGMLSRGLWLVRRELLADIGRNAPRAEGRWAEALRLDLWLRLYEFATSMTDPGG
jgi:hypothetical protein